MGFIICKLVFVLRKQLFWIFAPFGWVIAFRSFERVSSKRRVEITQPQRTTTQKTWFLYSHLVETSAHYFLINSNIFISDFVVFLDCCLVGV
jgi:hypothetical protein